MANAAISLCSTYDPDKDDPKKVTKAVNSKASNSPPKMFTNIWQCHWSQISPHELLYDLEYILTPTRTFMFKMPKTRWWGDHVQNTQAALVYDKWLHAAFGYYNGVFTAFLQPLQKVLAKTRNRNEDDATGAHAGGARRISEADAVIAEVALSKREAPK